MTSKEDVEQELNELRQNVKFIRWWVEHGQTEYVNNMVHTKSLLDNVNNAIDECRDPDKRLQLYDRRNALAESYGLLLQNFSKVMEIRTQLEPHLPELEKALE